MITAGSNTPLSGQTLIVDDDDPAIAYSGSWARKTGRFHSPPDPSSGQPYGNVTHESASPGASATFTFFGSSISVYSVFDYSHLGSTTVTYLLDSTASTKFYDVTSDSPEYQQGYLQRVNTLLWSSGTISAGEHTLKIELTSTTNGAALVLDYLVYTPSFGTLATKPQSGSGNGQGSGQGPAGATATTTPFADGGTSGSLLPSSGTGASKTASQLDTSTVRTGSNATSPNGQSGLAMGTVTVTGAVAGVTSPAILPATNSQQNSAHVAVIVGGAVGGIVCLFLLLLLVLFMKRVLKRQSPVILSPRSPVDEEVITPFTESFPLTGISNITEKGYGLPSPSFARAVGTNHDSHSESVAGSMSQTPSASSLAKYSSNDIMGISTINMVSDKLIGPLTAAKSSVEAENMTTLEDLVSEFNTAVLAHGRVNARVTELQNRISALTREDTGNEKSNGSQRRDTLLPSVPPPYEYRSD
ncbi:hypothetical protein H0H93_005942 [Arthromyces matolae]|nr:hypothetical protein H0H93_005942 [Arthromyces matolae]